MKHKHFTITQILETLENDLGQAHKTYLCDGYTKQNLIDDLYRIRDNSSEIYDHPNLASALRVMWALVGALIATYLF